MNCELLGRQQEKAHPPGGCVTQLCEEREAIKCCGKEPEVRRQHEDFHPLSTIFSDSLATKYVLSCCCVLVIIPGVRVVNQSVGPDLTEFTVCQGE